MYHDICLGCGRRCCKYEQQNFIGFPNWTQFQVHLTIPISLGKIYCRTNVTILIIPSISDSTKTRNTRNQDLWSCSRIWDVALWDEPIIVQLECQSVHSWYSFWPLTASITMEVNNNYAYAGTTQRTLNKFVEINFSMECTVWPWWCLLYFHK